MYSDKTTCVFKNKKINVNMDTFILLANERERLRVHIFSGHWFNQANVFFLL